MGAFNVGVNDGESAGQTVLYDLGRGIRDRWFYEPSPSTSAKAKKVKVEIGT